MSLRLIRQLPKISGQKQKAEFLCSCNRTTVTIIANVNNGNTKSCGHCHDISAEEMATRKFGCLKIKHPINVAPWSKQKVSWVCDCGRLLLASICNVIDRQTTRCGKCNEITAEEMATRVFGRLKLETLVPILPGSAKKVLWICLCGARTFACPRNVFSGQTKSCGKCSDTLRRKFAAGKTDIMALKTPIYPHQLPDWCHIALETIYKTNDPFRALCRLCDTEFFPRWYRIQVGYSLTCGCSTSRISKGQSDIVTFIKNLGTEVITEYRLGRLTYDIFVPSANLLIEFNGILWHSLDSSKQKDLDKYRNIPSTHQYLMVFEDEWYENRSKVEQLIRNRLGLNKPASVRPQKCEIRLILASEADPFLDTHHYIGKSRAPINFAAVYQGKTVACMSFNRPTRQSFHPWELVRMVSDPSVRVHGIWNRLLLEFIGKYSPSSIVSFSDNRLFSGAIYEKLGFKYDGEIDPDYYWVKGRKRSHKSGLRKTPEEKLTGKTETELRESQGYRKIWDLGKKRWVWWAK